MDEEIEGAWRAFLAESEEHLDAADRLLSRADALLPRDDIAALFRAFHSLKGLSMAMDLVNMQTLAHRAEDLLGVVREGRAALSGTLTTLLLEVVDRLRGMREWTEIHRADAEPAPDLVSRLEQTVGQAIADPAPPPGAAHDLAGLGDDDDMLALYLELLAERAPELARALADGDGAGTAASAEELIVGAEVIGLDQVASVLGGIVAHARALPDPAAWSGLLLGLADLRQQLGLLEEIAGGPAGADALGQALTRHARLDVAARLAVLRQALQAEDALDAALTLATAARVTLDAAGLANAAATLILVEDQIARAAQAEIAWTPALASLAREMTAAVEGLEQDLDAATAAALRANWQAGMRGGDAPPTPRGAITLAPELRAAVTEARMAQLDQRAAEGWHVFDLLLDTEGEPDIAADLTAWLSANAEVATSRTVSAGGMSWFEFLFASRAGLDEVRAAFATFDPDGRCVHGLRELSAATAPAAAEAPARATEAVIRVPVGAIDALLDGLDEMRVAMGGMEHALAGLRGAASGGHLAAAEDIQDRMVAMHRRLRDACLRLRVVPVETVFARYPRMARELATRLGREVDLEIDGREARIDKGMADLLIDPLMHLVRNAIDHGVEPPADRVRAGKPRRARLVLAATEHADGVHIAVCDDGRGLDRDAILAHAVARGLARPGAILSDRDVYDLLFRGGFSTAAEVTEISGRGVGLDVVAHTVARLGGRIDIDTVAGAGTTFTLRVPASASVRDVLLVEAGELVAIPQRRVVAVAMLDTAEAVAGERVLWYRDAPVPLHDLAVLLGFDAAPPEAAVIVEHGGRLVALAVERAPRRREVFLKELHPMLALLPAVAGATMLSDGRAVLVLDVDGVLRHASARGDARDDARAEAPAES